jgi:hypothetical protein
MLSCRFIDASIHKGQLVCVTVKSLAILTRWSAEKVQFRSTYIPHISAARKHNRQMIRVRIQGVEPRDRAIRFENIQHIFLRARKHNRQFARMTVTVAKSSAILTYWTAEKEQFRSEVMSAHFGSKKAQLSVGPCEGLEFRAEMSNSVRKQSAYFASKEAQSSVGVCDKDRRKIISDTHALKRRAVAIPFQLFSAHFSNKKSTIVGWSA